MCSGLPCKMLVRVYRPALGGPGLGDPLPLQRNCLTALELGLCTYAGCPWRRSPSGGGSDLPFSTPYDPSISDPSCSQRPCSLLPFAVCSTSPRRAFFDASFPAALLRATHTIPSARRVARSSRFGYRINGSFATVCNRPLVDAALLVFSYFSPHHIVITIPVAFLRPITPPSKLPSLGFTFPQWMAKFAKHGPFSGIPNFAWQRVFKY